jgi:LacI family transcriptional regulator
VSVDLLKKTTMKEVAELAGVSVATVDRVLSNRAKVSPHTKERVFAAIQQLNIQQQVSIDSGNTESNEPLRFLFLSESGANFLRSIEDAVLEIRELFSPHNITIHTKSLYPFNLESFLALLEVSSEQYDAIVLLCREDPAISSSVNRIVKAGCPIVCFTTDLCDTSRLSYVGPNHVSAGRTAGSLMGRYIGQCAGEVVLVVSAPYRSQYERELGFRRVIREQFPNLKILESLNNHDLDEESYDSLIKLFNSGVKPLGIYNVTGGTQGVAQALKEKGWSKDVVFIGHELNDGSYDLLSQNEVDIIIDQDLKSEALTAINVLMHHFERLQKEPMQTTSAPIITLRENMVVKNV